VLLSLFLLNFGILILLKVRVSWFGYSNSETDELKVKLRISSASQEESILKNNRLAAHKNLASGPSIVRSATHPVLWLMLGNRGNSEGIDLLDWIAQ